MPPGVYLVMKRSLADILIPICLVLLACAVVLQILILWRILSRPVSTAGVASAVGSNGTTLPAGGGPGVMAPPSPASPLPDQDGGSGGRALVMEPSRPAGNYPAPTPGEVLTGLVAMDQVSGYRIKSAQAHRFSALLPRLEQVLVGGGSDPELAAALLEVLDHSQYQWIEARFADRTARGEPAGNLAPALQSFRTILKTRMAADSGS